MIKERLPCGQPYERNPGGLHVIERAWLRSQIGCACNRILRCGTIKPKFSQRIDGLCDYHIGDASANFSDHSRDIMARNGQMTINTRWGFPGFPPRGFLPHDTRCIDTHQYLSLLWMWLRCVFVDKSLRTALSMDTYSFHVFLRSFHSTMLMVCIHSVECYKLHQKVRCASMRYLHRVQGYRAVLGLGWQKMPFASHAFSLSFVLRAVAIGTSIVTCPTLRHKLSRPLAS